MVKYITSILVNERVRTELTQLIDIYTILYDFKNPHMRKLDILMGKLSILYKEIIYLLFVGFIYFFFDKLGFIYHANIFWRTYDYKFLKVKMEDVNKKKQKKVQWKWTTRKVNFSISKNDDISFPDSLSIAVCNLNE